MEKFKGRSILTCPDKEGFEVKDSLLFNDILDLFLYVFTI